MAERKTREKAGKMASGVQLQPYSAILVSSSLERSLTGPPDDVADGDVSLHYGANATKITDLSNDIVYHCSFSAGLTHKDEKIFLLEAEYVFGMIVKNGPLDDLPKEMIEPHIVSSVWSKFRDYYALMNSQAGMNIPLLPQTVDLSFEAADEDPE